MCSGNAGSDLDGFLRAIEGLQDADNGSPSATALGYARESAGVLMDAGLLGDAVMTASDGIVTLSVMYATVPGVDAPTARRGGYAALLEMDCADNGLQVSIEPPSGADSDDIDALHAGDTVTDGDADGLAAVARFAHACLPLVAAGRMYPVDTRLVGA